MHIDMHWWDFTTKSFRRFSAVKNTYSHALMGPKQKIFSAIFSYQEYSWTYIGRTLTQNLFGGFQLSKILMNMHRWNVNTKSFQRFAAIKNTYWHALVRPQHEIFSVNFSYQDCILACIGRNFTQNLFGGFQISRIFITCNDRRWTQNLFSDLQRSRILLDVHWRDLSTKSFRWFSATKNTFWHALVGP